MTVRAYNYVDKNCVVCGTLFTPTGQNHKICTKSCRNEHLKSSGKAKEYRDRFNLKNGVQVGVGSGGTTGSGKENPMYSHGRFTFRNTARKLVRSGVPCTHCGKDLRNANRGDWVGHHIDHNPTNNDLNNLMILCKKCHHFHHETYRNLPSLKNVQRLSRQGVGETSPEAPSIHTIG